MTNREYVTFEADVSGGQPTEIVEIDGRRTLTGYAVVWGAISSPRADGKRYRFDPGSIEWAPEVFALLFHDWKQPIASTGNQTLRMKADDKGVQVEIDISNTSRGNDAFVDVQNRLIRGMSFGGDFVKIEPTVEANVMRVIKFAGAEVTLTHTPAMVETSIEVLTDAVKAEKKKEDQRLQQQKLNQYKLAMYRTGSVSGSTSRQSTT